jgi:hypothetical protein
MKTVKTIVFIEEIPTDGHSPMKFICNDGQVYFCKYRLTSKIEELDCLIYEVIGHFLLKSLDIPTPDIALVELIERVFTKKDIPRNCKYAKPLTICFGSKEVKNANLISGLESVVDAHQTLCDPYDLLRIAIFDLWVDNADRGKNNNYNLLTSSHENKLKVWAFDHAFIFGGIPKLRIFNPNFQPIIQNNLFTAPYFSTVLRQLNPQKCMEVATQFIDNLVNSTSVLDSAFEQIPENWQVYPILKIKIRNFLLDSQRLKTIEKLTFQYLSKQ